jgi:hypothetical protein
MAERKMVVGKSSAPKKIAKIQFGTFLTEEIQQISDGFLIFDFLFFFSCGRKKGYDIF